MTMSNDNLFPAQVTLAAHHDALIRHARRLETSLEVDRAREKRIAALECTTEELEKNMRDDLGKLTEAVTGLQIALAKSHATTRIMVAVISLIAVLASKLLH